MTNDEIKNAINSPRGLWIQIWFALGGFIVCAAALHLIFGDPFGWFTGSPEVRDAKQGIAGGSFITLFVLPGIWYCIIYPLKHGVTTGGGYKYGPPLYVVFRSEDPKKFRSLMRWNVAIVLVGLLMGVGCLAVGIHQL